MTGAEFQDALQRLRMTKGGLARETGVHRVTLQRYVNGNLAVPLLLERYITLLLQARHAD